MNRQQYQSIRHWFHESRVITSGFVPAVRDFDQEIQPDVQRLLNLSQRCDMLTVRAEMKAAGVYEPRMYIPHCAPQSVLERYKASLARRQAAARRVLKIEIIEAIVDAMLDGTGCDHLRDEAIENALEAPSAFRVAQWTQGMLDECRAESAAARRHEREYQ